MCTWLQEVEVQMYIVHLWINWQSDEWMHTVFETLSIDSCFFLLFIVCVIEYYMALLTTSVLFVSTDLLF